MPYIVYLVINIPGIRYIITNTLIELLMYSNALYIQFALSLSFCQRTR